MFHPSATLPDALAAAAQRGSGEFVFHLEQGPVRLSHAELADRARAGAQALAACGIRPGDAVGVLGPNRPEWLISAFAVWTAGAVLVPLQIPLRVRNVDAFQQQIRSLVDAGGCKLVLTAPELEFAVRDDVRTGWAPSRPGDAAADVAAADAAVIQFTSGSTAAPKGAVLSHAAVLAQMQALDHVLDGGAGEVVLLSWVPFFHDLGLFLSLVAPAVLGATAHLLPTERFARDPAEWLRLVGRTGATVTVAPCSAWSAATRPALRGSERVDLSSLRVAWFAAEGVDPDTVDRVVAAKAKLRLDPAALGATYGLAETVLCATSTRPGTGVRFDHVDLDEMAAWGRATPAGDGGATRRVVCSGHPALGTQVRIVDAGVDLPERQLGEVYLRGPSLMSGYVGATGVDPFEGGWLRTGDIGYLADGELFVTGRAKDVMIVMGRNYYPDDFEWAAGRVTGVRTGRCVAFVDDHPRERLVLLVEPSAAAEAGRGLAGAVRHAVSDAVGTPPDEVLVLPPGTIEKTTSGKLRRGAMRDAYRRGELIAPKAA